MIAQRTAAKLRQNGWTKARRQAGAWTLELYDVSCICYPVPDARGALKWTVRVVRQSDELGGPVAMECLARNAIEAMEVADRIRGMTL